MARDDGDVFSSEPVAERPPWMLLGCVLFVLAFVLGWRSARGKQPEREAVRELPA